MMVGVGPVAPSRYFPAARASASIFFGSNRLTSSTWALV